MIKKLFGGEKNDVESTEDQASMPEQGMGEDSSANESHEGHEESASESTEEERPQQ